MTVTGTGIAMQGVTTTDNTGPDPVCQNATQIDLNRGLICMVDSRPGYGNWSRHIYTESYDTRVRSWGELKADMTYAALINSPYAASARRMVWYQNTSWHLDPALPPDKQGAVFDGNYSVVNVPDSYVPKYIGPTAPGDTKVYIVDPKTGTRIDTTNVTDPTTPITDDGRSIQDLVYPNGIPIKDKPPVIYDTGTVGDGTPINGPLGYSPDQIPIIPPRPSTTSVIGDIRTLVDTAQATEPNAGSGKQLLWILGAGVILALLLSGG